MNRYRFIRPNFVQDKREREIEFLGKRKNVRERERESRDFHTKRIYRVNIYTDSIQSIIINIFLDHPERYIYI